MDEEVAMVVRQAALTLKDAGADVSEVSVPIHNDGMFAYHLIGYVVFFVDR